MGAALAAFALADEDTVSRTVSRAALLRSMEEPVT
jgi:hypothetical protein